MNKMTLEPPANRQAICVFCGASHGADPVFTETARQFGTAIAREGFDLVFGGGGVGLMGEVATSVAKGGGKVLGIIPGTSNPRSRLLPRSSSPTA
jgi:predicted Rossmann-fold nucleotide-binding protein